jgi:salicylate hydroxylase
MRIVIVGAGVAGCILTRSLSRLRGAEVVCLERVRAGEHVDFGTGLNIGPNGVKALRAHDPALAEAVTALSFPWRSWKVSLTDGTPLLHLPLASVADTEGWRIRWSEFYRVLRDAAAPAITYGCTITHVAPCECDAEKTCIEWLQDGAERRLDDVDLLVATDGRCSQVRWTISGAPAPRHVGVAISRVLVPDTSGGLIDDYEQWFNGPNHLLGFRVPPAHVYAACTFPIPPDEPIPEALERPEAIREMYVPQGGKLSAPAQWTLDALCARAADLQWARMQWHCLRYADPDWNVLYLGRCCPRNGPHARAGRHPGDRGRHGRWRDYRAGVGKRAAQSAPVAAPNHTRAGRPGAFRHAALAGSHRHHARWRRSGGRNPAEAETGVPGQAARPLLRRGGQRRSRGISRACRRAPDGMTGLTA